MINTNIFDQENVKFFEEKFLMKLNSNNVFKTARVISSPRSVGDIVQEITGECLPECFPEGVIVNFSAAFARKSMADVAFYDSSNNYFTVDIKTHNKNTNFNMPNLTSVERLAKLYEKDHKFFVILLVEYIIKEGQAVFTSARLIPIEHLEWNCLRIGALGWGQIQIANSNIININPEMTRKDWILQLCDHLEVFYPKEIKKLQNRLEYFAKIHEFWRNK